MDNRSRRRPLRLYIRFYLQCAEPVQALEFLITRLNAIGSHRFKGHLCAAGRANIHITQIGNGQPIFYGVPDHHLDVFSPPRDTLRLRTIEGLPHLSRDVRETYPQGFC